jgi:hypothetical protein
MPISLSVGALLGRRPRLPPEEIRALVVPPATTKEHKRNEPATDEQRSQATRDPSVLIHHRFAARVRRRDSPNDREGQYADQGSQQNVLARAETFHGSNWIACEIEWTSK